MRLYKKYDPDEEESDECIIDDESVDKNPPRISQDQSKSVSIIFNQSSVQLDFQMLLDE